MKKLFKTIKLEFFYWRRMFKRRFPLRFMLNYTKNRYFGLYMLKKLETWLDPGHHDDFEIHVLAPKSGLWMLAWNLRSFLYHSKLSPTIVIHSDGSIDSVIARMFESKFPNLRVILREEADQTIDAMPMIPDNIKKYRYGKNILILLFTDVYLLSKSETVMLLDFDFMFYAPPSEIIDFVENNLPYDTLATRFSKDDQRPSLYLKDDYVKKYQLLEKRADQLISGIIVFRKSLFPLEKFIEYFENTTDPENFFIEQAGWASMVCQTNFQWLDEKRYPVKGRPPEAVCKHFTGPHRFELYAHDLDLVRKNISNN